MATATVKEKRPDPADATTANSEYYKLATLRPDVFITLLADALMVAARTTGVCLHYTSLVLFDADADGGLQVVATDGHRLGVRQVEAESLRVELHSPPALQVKVAADDLRKLVRVIKALKVDPKDAQVLIDTEGVKFSSPRGNVNAPAEHSNTWPDWRRIFDTAKHNRMARLNLDLLQGIEGIYDVSYIEPEDGQSAGPLLLNGGYQSKGVRWVIMPMRFD
jgi:hypothetical protein